MLVVAHEHPEWQKPLFSALDRRGVRYGTFDLKHGAFDPDRVPDARLYFNQASPSAYVRGNTRAVPLALSLIRSLVLGGARVLNGSAAFSLELSKSTQAALMQRLGIAHPRTLVFNDADSALAQWDRWPALLKPEQGGSGARMYLLNSPDELTRLLRDRPELWHPDNFAHAARVFQAPSIPSESYEWSFYNGELLYAMRVIAHGAYYTSCPSEVCNPVTGGDRTAKSRR